MSSTPHDRALVFIQQNIGQHLSGDRQLLVDRCVAHLQQSDDLSTTRAERISAQALGAIESRGRGMIDVGASTEYAVVVRASGNNATYLITAAALLLLAEQYNNLAIPINRH